MPIADIPIHLGMVKAVDEVGLKTHSQAMVDVYVDEMGSVNRRPGLASFVNLGTSAAVDGLFWWPTQSMAIAISNGNTYKITASDGTFSQISGDSFATGTRVKFADWGTHLYAANGANIKQISTSAVANLADADAPTTVTHPVILDKYLIGNEGSSGNFHWSDVNAPTTWSANSAEAEANLDNLVAMDVRNLELYLLGAKTLEVWYDDGSTPFIRMLQGFVERGTVAPYSFEWCPELSTFLWMDQNRQVVALEGRTVTPISPSMTKYIHGFSTVNDAVGDYFEITGRPYYILAFPTEGKSLVYDFRSKQWYEWGYWNSGSAVYERFRGNCYCLAEGWNFALVGDRANGRVYKMQSGTYTDNTDTLRSLVRTGHINHNTSEWKRSKYLRFRIKRTEVSPGASSLTMLLRYRDNGETSWSNQKTITVSALANETDYQATITRLGRYRSRQWEFVLTDDAALAIVQVQEEFDYL